MGHQNRGTSPEWPDRAGQRRGGLLEMRQADSVHSLLAADVEEFEPGEEPLLVQAPSFVYELEADALPADIVAALAKLAPNF